MSEPARKLTQAERDAINEIAFRKNGTYGDLVLFLEDEMLFDYLD